MSQRSHIKYQVFIEFFPGAVSVTWQRCSNVWLVPSTTQWNAGEQNASRPIRKTAIVCTFVDYQEKSLPLMFGTVISLAAKGNLWFFADASSIACAPVAVARDV